MAQEKDKRPKEPFNAVADEPELEVVFESDMDNELQDASEEELRENTSPKLDHPKFKNTGLTPSGTTSMFGKPRISAESQPQTNTKATSQESHDRDRQEELRTGDHTFEEEFNGLRVRTWIADDASSKGIRGGHITEMVVTDGEYGKETELAHFKNGEWEKRAEATPERQAIMEAVTSYDGEFLRAKKQEEEHNEQREIDNSKDKGQSR